MEILLVLACLLARASGAQSEQAKLGLSPAQRDILKEQTRHKRAVQKIADKHAVSPTAVEPDLTGPLAKGHSPAVAPDVSSVQTLPEAFRSGWRGYIPLERVATPVGRRVGGWAAQGIAWAKDTGRGALREYRKRRTSDGHEDPAPVLVPLPPAHPPTVPPMPDFPPGVEDGDDPTGIPRSRDPSERDADDEQRKPSEPPEKGVRASPEAPEAPGATEPLKGPETAAEKPKTDPARAAPEEGSDQPPPEPAGDAPAGTQEADPVAAPDPAPAATAEPPSADAPTPGTAGGTGGTEPVPDTPKTDTPTDTTGTETAGAVTPPGTPTSEPATAGGGAGRMAAEVSYDSVLEESDELVLMCQDDSNTYDRINKRCEREISRGDALIAALDRAGFGPRVISWVARCKDYYGGIHGQVADLKNNTTAQAEAVVRAKGLLIAGQGLYAGIAQDMESVAERESYISDAVDSEDTNAHAETYESIGA
ncbi:hypothetical protein [Streptomyces sp. NRRL S-1868]|uniref:hypothetical protein n=1 Tax=Streptomyces sp. NRRL S-1868 TaxID=1463892 RepID=UPI0004CB491C|nr:hypothetical protein [Streptomyces sp. NRRL S-1868]